MTIHNSLTRQKEKFEPINDRIVGMYVCGPTVYSDVHLGNCRTFISFDIVYRYLMYLGYKVRYVRNITDVGHLEGDVDTGAEDKIGKKARLEQLEPMEIVQRYTNGFHAMMDSFNVLRPNIEPSATGHILEQISMVQQILDNGFAYEVNGSVYFDTMKMVQESGMYGQLSGRKVEDLIAESRDDLKNQGEKRHPSDFAIWIKADPSHLMRWPSPWSEGFPGWHLECSTMSTKYLGETFDIHGGGNDLKFPHHENEIAQNYGVCKCSPAKYWMHGNMLLLNGKKMSKSDGNSISPKQLFTGENPHISKGYSPMVVRFFMLQTHYRSTLDLNDEALQAAEKGYRRLMEGNKIVQQLEATPGAEASELDRAVREQMLLAEADMNDDFNTPKALSRVFDLVSKANAIQDGHLDAKTLSAETLAKWKTFFQQYLFDIFGLRDEMAGGSNGQGELLDELIRLLIEMRQDARANKDYATSDKIRDALKEKGVVLKDSKEGTTWVIEI